MHIVIIGVGGVGGYFGGKLALAGEKVTLVARGKHLQAIQDNGLQVHSIDGDFSTQPHLATNTLEGVELADVILVCTKSWQVAAVAEWIAPILQETTIVIPLQNGADNIQQLLTAVPEKNIVGGLCKIYSKIEAPGVISHFGHPPELIFGALDNQPSGRLQNVQKVFQNAGFSATIPPDIHVAIWSKFMFIATVSGLGALTRAAIGEMYASIEIRKLLEQSAIEIYTIGIAKGVALPESIVGSIMHFIANQPFDATSSTQRDMMAERPSELENFNGFIVKAGKQLNIPTPTHSFVYNCLLPMETKARQ